MDSSSLQKKTHFTSFPWFLLRKLSLVISLLLVSSQGKNMYPWRHYQRPNSWDMNWKYISKYGNAIQRDSWILTIGCVLDRRITFIREINTPSNKIYFVPQLRQSSVAIPPKGIFHCCAIPDLTDGSHLFIANTMNVRKLDKEVKMANKVSSRTLIFFPYPSTNSISNLTVLTTHKQVNKTTHIQVNKTFHISPFKTWNFL